MVASAASVFLAINIMNSKDIDKIYIRSQELLADSFRLAAAIYASGFRPHFIVGIWRGGSPVGIAVQEYFEFRRVETDHIAIRTSSYTAIGEQSGTIRVHGLNYIIDNVNAGDSLLIVDDVFDSGRSIKAVLEELAKKTRRNMPSDLKIACPWYKPNNNKVDIVPDYYIHKTDQWLVFPHELAGLSIEEIREGKQELSEIYELLVN